MKNAKEYWLRNWGRPLYRDRWPLAWFVAIFIGSPLVSHYFGEAFVITYAILLLLAFFFSSPKWVNEDREESAQSLVSEETQSEVYAKTLEYLKTNNAAHMDALWQKYGNDEQDALCQLFNLVQRSRIRKLILKNRNAKNR